MGPAARGVKRGSGDVSRKRYNRKECRERGWTALAASVVAVALLVGTWIYVHSQTSEGRHAHISMHLVVIDVGAPLGALWLAWNWVAYRRGLKQSMSSAP